jgi:hypothetical protein
MLKMAYPAEDPYTVLSTLLNRLPPGDNALIAFLYVGALIAIMFSTLDALCSAVSFTVHVDLFHGKRVIVAKLLTIALLCFYVMYYLFLKRLTGDQLDAILYASWSLQVALMPAVLTALFALRAYTATMFSLIAGVVGATILMPLGMTDQVFELAPSLALLFAIAGFIIGWVLERIIGRRQLAGGARHVNV